MDKFTASNGLTVDGTTGRIIVRDRRTVFPKYDLGKYTGEALRESPTRATWMPRS